MDREIEKSLPMTFAHARNSDPATSHEAAESVKDITELQSRILYLFGETENGFIDEELIKAYNRAYGYRYPATESSLRSRRSDLHHKGLLEKAMIHKESVTRKTEAGRDSQVYLLAGRLF
jgi:hypothetical protein